MSRTRIFILTMIIFAGNTLLCRMVYKLTGIDAGPFAFEKVEVPVAENRLSRVPFVHN